MYSKRWDAAIVGSGAGGLVLALELAKKGFRVALLDKTFGSRPLDKTLGSGPLDRRPRGISPRRGEILQPNGLKILDRLGLLSDLLKADVHRNDRVHFHRGDGPRLLTVDYRTLPPPYSYSLVLLPEAAQRLLLDAAAASPNIDLFWGAAFRSVLREAGRVVGLEADYEKSLRTFRAPIVVGGDGARSAVRAAFGIKHRLKEYADGYLTAVVDRPPGFEGESRYYLGRRMIFGAFPISKSRLYLFYMIPAGSFDRVREKGLDRFKEALLSLNADARAFLETPLRGLSSWDEVSYMPCFRVQCDRWVVDGGALLGDAAHAMNPHVAQGRNLAMEDGVVLAGVIQNCFKRGEFSAVALSSYERGRRPAAEILQRLGDEMTWIWNSGWPPLVWTRERIFRSLEKRRDLRDKILRTVAGLEIASFRLYDRWRALWP